MKKNPQNKEKDTNKKDKTKKDKLQDNEMKKSFFKKVWYSIDKIEKYSELSAEGFFRAIKYLGILILILAMVSSASAVYNTSKKVNDIAQYIEKNAPEFTYNNEGLNVDSQEPIIDENEYFGKIIVDSNIDDQEKINEYLNEIQEESGILVLKDKLIIKQGNTKEIINYNYNDLFEEIGITEFNKKELVEYLTDNNMMLLYFNLFLLLAVSTFAICLINTLLYIIVISICGYLASMILRLKLRYVAVFNMAVYSITLSTLLDMIYIVINALYNYHINYFNVMYVLVASIYMIAAIFMLKIEFNKKQGEVQKIIEVEKETKDEIKKKDYNNDENKDSDKENKEDNEENNDTQNGETPEGSNA